jgi:predicted phosphodiesterase
MITRDLIDGTVVAVLADCHIHPGGGPAFPSSLFEALEGVDVIVTLGDMGEAAGLDQLAEVAPVIGVRGQDDADDARTANRSLLLTSPAWTFGCIFDPVAAGLATSADPFTPVANFDAAAREVFGRPVRVLFYASTHKPSLVGPAVAAGLDFAANPGSAVLPGAGSKASFFQFVAGQEAFHGELVELN